MEKFQRLKELVDQMTRLKDITLQMEKAIYVKLEVKTSLMPDKHPASFRLEDTEAAVLYEYLCKKKDELWQQIKTLVNEEEEIKEELPGDFQEELRDDTQE